MTSKKDHFDNMEILSWEVMELMKKKNQDYSGEDPFSSFKKVAHQLDISVEKAILVMISTKVGRINQVLENGGPQVKEEQVVDSVKDLVAYSLILGSYLKEVKNGN